MRHPNLRLLIAVLLLAAAPAGAQDGREQLHVDIPEGMREVHREGTQQVVVVEHVPAGQTVEQWTDKVTVLIFAPEVYPDLDSKLQQTSAALTDACLVRPRIFDPVRFEDAGFPAVVLSVACGKGKRTRDAGVFISKSIQGAQGTYEVQRIWRFPPAAESAAVPLTQAMAETAQALMATVYLCDGPKARPC